METPDHSVDVEQLGPVNVLQEEISEDKQASDTSEVLEQITNSENIKEIENDEEVLEQITNDDNIREGENAEENALITMRDVSFMETIYHHVEKLSPGNNLQGERNEDQQPSDTSEVLERNKNDEKIREEENARIAREESDMETSDHRVEVENLDQVNVLQEETSEDKQTSDTSDVLEQNTNDENIREKELALIITREDSKMETPIDVEQLYPVNVLQQDKIDDKQPNDTSKISEGNENVEQLKEGENENLNSLIIMKAESIMDESDHPEHVGKLDPVFVLQENSNDNKQLSDTSESIEWNKASLDNVSDCQQVLCNDEISKISENIEDLDKLLQKDDTLKAMLPQNMANNGSMISLDDKAIADNMMRYAVTNVTNVPDYSENESLSLESNHNEFDRTVNALEYENKFHSYWEYRDAELFDVIQKVTVDIKRPTESVKEFDTSFKYYNDKEERTKSHTFEMNNLAEYFKYNDAEVKHNILKASTGTTCSHQQHYTSDGLRDIILEPTNIQLIAENNNYTNTSNTLIQPPTCNIIAEQDSIIQNQMATGDQDKMSNYTIASDLSEDKYKMQNRNESLLFEQNIVTDHWKYVDAERMYAMHKLLDDEIAPLDHLKQDDYNNLTILPSEVTDAVLIENRKEFDEQSNKLNAFSNNDDDELNVPDSEANTRATSFLHEERIYSDYWKYIDAEILYNTYKTCKINDVSNTQAELQLEELPKDMSNHEPSILDMNEIPDKPTQIENVSEKQNAEFIACKKEPLYSEVVSGMHKNNSLDNETSNYELDGKGSTITDLVVKKDEPGEDQQINASPTAVHADNKMEDIVLIPQNANLVELDIIAAGNLKQEKDSIEQLLPCQKQLELCISTTNDASDSNEFINETTSTEYVNITNSSGATNDDTENVEQTHAMESVRNAFSADLPKETLVCDIDPSIISIIHDDDGSEKAQLFSTPHQDVIFWEDKPLYDDAEATYIKSLESSCIAPEQDSPMITNSTDDSIDEEQAQIQLIQATNERLTNPLLQNPATNSNPTVSSPNPINHISLGTTSTVNISNPKETVDDCTIYKQTHSESVENILQSLLNEELKMNNLPYDNINSLIKGLQILIEKLSDYKEQSYAISTTLPQNADQRVKDSVRLIDDRIDFLRQRAHDGLEKIQQSLKLREQRKSTLDSYFKMLEEIELWMATTSILLTDFDSSLERHSLEEILHQNQGLLTDLREKEYQSKSIYEMTENYLIYNDTRDKAEPLRESLSNIIRIIREKALILEDNIQRLKQLVEPSTALKVDNEMQTSPLISMDCTDNIATKHQEASSQANLDRSTDNLIIIQSISEGEETVQISNVRNISSIESDNDIIVEAKYTPLKHGETNKMSEIVLQNIPTSTFETTFVEPDDSTTEIKVTKDGSRKITLKKVIQPIESIESSDVAKTSVTATIQPESSVLICSDNITTEGQICDDQKSEPRQIVGSILEDIQCEIMDVMEKSEAVPSEEQYQNTQVLESVAQKVDLIASIVDSPNCNIESTQRTSDYDTNLTEPKCSPTTEYSKESILGISDVWPQLEEPPINVSVTTTKTLSHLTPKAPLSGTDETVDIWPNNMNTGSDKNTAGAYFNEPYSMMEAPSQNAYVEKQIDTLTLPEIQESADTQINKMEDSSILTVQLGNTTDEIMQDPISPVTKPLAGSPIEKILMEPEPIHQSLHFTSNEDDLPRSEIHYEQNVEANKPETGSLVQAIDLPVEECTIRNLEQEDTPKNSENPVITKDEHDKQLQVKVSSLKDDQSAVTLSMNMDYVSDKNVKVSLVELDTTSKNVLPVFEEEIPVSEEHILVEKIPGLSDVDIDKGYEADKTTMEGESENDDASKKRKRKKKKAKQDADKDETSNVISELPKDRIETSNLKQESDPNRIDPSEIIESCVLDSAELATPLQYQLVLPTEVIEATHVENVHQQTTPVQKDSYEDETDREIALITSDTLLVPLDFEQKSIQTSPENESVKLSKQTSPIICQSVDVDCKEVQTEVQALETETQTVPIEDKEHKEQDIQTEWIVTKTIEEDEPKPEVTDTANQTVFVTTSEIGMQTADDLNQLVEPILDKIIDSTVELGVEITRKSVQTSPIGFIEAFSDDTTPSDAKKEFVQATDIDVVDVQTSTEATYEDRGSSPAVPYAVSEIEIQTSPVHTITAGVETHPQISSKPTTDDCREETNIIQFEKTDAQAQTESTETSIQSTQTTVVEQPHKSDLQKKKTRSKKGKKSNLIPIEVEVTTEMSVTECEHNFEPISITKSHVDGNTMDSTNALNVQIQVEFEHPKHIATYKQINDEILEDKTWTINLADYFSIIRSQKSFAEDKIVPWSEVATMLSKIWSECNKDTIHRPDYFYKPMTSEEYVDNSTDVENVQSLLNQNGNNLELQNQIIFDELENMNIQAEEILFGICHISKWNESDRLHQQRIYGVKLQRIMDKIKYLTKYTAEKNIDTDHHITMSLDQTKQAIEQLTICLAAEENTNQSISEIVHNILTMLQQTKNRLHDIDDKINSAMSDTSLSVNEKLSDLEENEEFNNECMTKLITISEQISNSKSAMVATNIEEDFKNVDQMARKIQQTITLERNKLLQLIGLAEEYEQTLLEFEEIAYAAAEFIDNEISTNSLKELEEEMQRHRKFFVNLSHCKMILESLESNLDPLTRTKHADLHSALYNKTSIILERAVDRAARLAQAASKWTVLEKEMRDESQWLQVAQQRVPDLQNVSSEDYEQYIKLYESLNQDILRHHSKMVQHNQIAKIMQEFICAPSLEKDSSEALTVVTALKEEVSLYLNKLQKFKNHWNRYNTAADKLHEWVCHAQKHLSAINFPLDLAETPVEDMRKFWEVKAQYEVINNKVYEIACSSLDKALTTINITDEELQRQLYNQLLDNWTSVSTTIIDMQNHVYNSIKTSSTSSTDKITFIENELRDITSTINNLKGVLKSSEDLYLYLENMQTLKTRFDLIDTELGQIALATDFNVEKITELFEMSTNVSHQINEEYEAAENFYKRLEIIENGIKAQEKHFIDIAKVLDECGSRINGKRPDVEKALDDCKICQSELSDSWSEMMKLRQMLHTLPMNLKVTISPQQTERDLSVLQNIHSDLERKCEENMSLLRDRLVLWNKFHRQLETIQNHIQETEFMMDLIQLHETADYHRLLKATERLDALLVEIEHKKHTIDDLQTIAKPLLETSEPSVSTEIQETVEQITVLWQNTQENLHDLCQRYEKAVKLWDRYNNICESVKDCISQNTSDNKEIDDIQVLRQYQEAVTERKRDLDKLKQFIEGINKQVGFNIGDTMLSEIDEFARRMEDIAEDIAFQINATASKHEERAIIQTTYATSNAVIKQIQQDLNVPLPDSEYGNTIMELETNLLNLCSTEAGLKNTVFENQSNSEDKNICADFKNLHAISFALLQDTLLQHQNLLQQTVLQKDERYLLKYWEQFLHHTVAFLDNEIPSEYSRLQQYRDQHSVLGYLIRQWKTSMLKIFHINSGLHDSYAALNQQHNYCVQKLSDNNDKIEEYLLHWKNFKSLQTTLQESITNIEAEKQNLQMEYINIKELPKLIAKVDNLQARFSALEVDVFKMNREVDHLTSRLTDEQVNAELKNEQTRTTQRISKLAENVSTWRRFLICVSELQSNFKSQYIQIKDSLSELEQCLCNFQRDNPVTSQHHLNMLKNEKLRLTCVKEELQSINITKEKLQYCTSPFDAKHIHKKVKGLWQLFEKQEYTISMLLKQMEERTQNRKLFLNHYNLLMEWIIEFEKRLTDSNKYEMCEEDTNFIKSIEDMLLQEVSCKESEIIWFNAIGKDLMKALSPGEEQKEICSKLEFLNEAWAKLLRHCQNRSQKISEVSSTAISLNQRINDIEAWMAEIEWELKQPLIFENIEKGCLDKLLDDYEKLQRSIEGNSGNIAEILNLCEMLFMDVESWNVHIDRRLISHSVKSLEMRWKHICIDTSTRKKDLLAIWNMLVELQRIIDSNQSWIEQTNEYLDNIQTQTNNAADKEELCDILQNLSIKYGDIIGQESVLQILRKLYISINKHDRIERSNMHNISRPAKQLLQTWEKLVWKFNSIKTRIEELTNLYSSFNSEYENIIVSLTQIDVEVTNIKHLQEGTVDPTPETKFKRLRDLHNELKFVINLFDAQDELGSSLIGMLPDKSPMSEEVRNRIMEYHQLANNIKCTLDLLVDQTSYGSAEKSERDFAVQVDTLPSLSITAKDAYLYQLQSAIAEAKSNLTLFKSAISEINASNFMTSTQTISKASAACESSIELIKHLNALLTSECSCTEEEAMSSTINKECEKYTLYLSEWHTKQQKMEELSNDDYLTCPLCTNRNWQQIDNDLWRLEQWLSMAETSQRSQHTQPSNDIDILEDAIQDHREFLLDLDSHKSIIKSLNIVGEHLATHTLDTEKALKLRERLQNNNKRWDKVCNQASHWQALLHRTLMENKEFHRTVTELSIWLEQTENKIKSSEPIDLTMDKAVIERKFKIFMELRNDLVRCEPRIVSLQETTSQLTKYLDESTSPKFNEIYAKLTDLRLRFHSIRRLVEVYTVKIAAALGTDGPLDRITITAECSQRNQESSGSFSQVATHDANVRRADDEDHINTTVLTRSYRFLGRVLRASLPIQAMLLLLLGVATLMPHGEDYSCSFTNNFARSLEPMLRYPNGPPPI